MAYQLEDEFGDIIGKARRGNGLSLNHVANEAGITDAQLSQMEAYTLKPTEDQVHKIAKALGLSGSKLADIAMERWAPAPVPSELDEKLDVERISGRCWWVSGERLSPNLQGNQANGCYRHCRPP